MKIRQVALGALVLALGFTLAVPARAQSIKVVVPFAAGGLQGTTGNQGFRERLERDVAYWGPQIKKLGIGLE